MKQNCNCECAKLINELMKKLDLLEPSKTIEPIEDFDIDTFDKASKKLCCSVSTLRRAINDGRLKKDIHYRHNGRKKYLFSTSQLACVKGTL